MMPLLNNHNRKIIKEHVTSPKWMYQIFYRSDHTQEYACLLTRTSPKHTHQVNHYVKSTECLAPGAHITILKVNWSWGTALSSQADSSSPSTSSLTSSHGERSSSVASRSTGGHTVSTATGSSSYSSLFTFLPGRKGWGWGLKPNLAKDKKIYDSSAGSVLRWLNKAHHNREMHVCWYWFV